MLPELLVQLTLGDGGVALGGLERPLFNLLVRMLLIFLPSPLLDAQEIPACFPKVGGFIFKTSQPPASASGFV